MDGSYSYGPLESEQGSRNLTERVKGMDEVEAYGYLRFRLDIGSGRRPEEAEDHQWAAFGKIGSYESKVINGGLGSRVIEPGAVNHLHEKPGT